MRTNKATHVQVVCCFVEWARRNHINCSHYGVNVIVGNVTATQVFSKWHVVLVKPFSSVSKPLTVLIVFGDTINSTLLVWRTSWLFRCQSRCV
jgi:hypothetical protein